MLTPSKVESAVEKEVKHILEHVRNDFEYNEEFQHLDCDTTPIYHYIVSGSHVDPDLGREYVPHDGGT